MIDSWCDPYFVRSDPSTTGPLLVDEATRKGQFSGEPKQRTNDKQPVRVFFGSKAGDKRSTTSYDVM